MQKIASEKTSQKSNVENDNIISVKDNCFIPKVFKGVVFCRLSHCIGMLFFRKEGLRWH
jgi:hypothetical protein